MMCLQTLVAMTLQLAFHVLALASGSHTEQQHSAHDTASCVYLTGDVHLRMEHTQDAVGIWQ